MKSSSTPSPIPGPGRWILVLGAPSRADGSLSAAQHRRLLKALELWRRTPDALLVCLGGAALNAHVESETMARYLRQRGVSNSRIFCETGTTDTRQQILWVRRAVLAAQPASVEVVTDTVHTLRAALLWRTLPVPMPATFHGARVKGLRLTLKLAAYEIASTTLDLIQMKSPLHFARPWVLSNAPFHDTPVGRKPT